MLLNNLCILHFFGKQKIKLHARDNYSCAIGAEGELYSWGYNIDGRLGLGTNHNILLPSKVPFPKGRRVVQIALGTSHCVALTLI